MLSPFFTTSDFRRGLTLLISAISICHNSTNQHFPWMKIAIEGCCHGELQKIYETLVFIEQKHHISIDLLICCGDFQSVRDNNDLDSLNCPQKYRELKDFHLYYSGKLKAPIKTLFIGGNHEASTYLFENYHGGWVCENIYFMGYSGVIQFGGLTIGGISGIYKNFDFRSGYHEKLPFDDSGIRSICHVREYEVFKLLQYKKPIDIFLSHDWPTNITNYGNVDELLAHKQHFRQDIQNGELGSKASEKLLWKLKPYYWFSGHMHCKFTAVVQHDNNEVTKFLALDKCLPNRDFLQILDMEANTDDRNLYYDSDWLTILRCCEKYFTNDKYGKKLPDVISDDEFLKEKKWILTNDIDLKIPEHFRENQQLEFCKMVGLSVKTLGKQVRIETVPNPDEISLE
jgi:lariat debranching enzyme